LGLRSVLQGLKPPLVALCYVAPEGATHKAFLLLATARIKSGSEFVCDGL